MMFDGKPLIAMAEEAINDLQEANQLVRLWQGFLFQDLYQENCDKDQHEPLPLTNRGNIDSSHTIYVFCIVNLPTVYATVDGRNPAPPWKYKTLSVMG